MLYFLVLLFCSLYSSDDEGIDLVKRNEVLSTTSEHVLDCSTLYVRPVHCRTKIRRARQFVDSSVPTKNERRAARIVGALLLGDKYEQQGRTAECFYVIYKRPARGTDWTLSTTSEVWDSSSRWLGPSPSRNVEATIPSNFCPTSGFFWVTAKAQHYTSLLWSLGPSHYRASYPSTLCMAYCISNGLSSISSGLIKLRKTNHYFIFPRSADELKTWISAIWRCSTFSVCRSCLRETTTNSLRRTLCAVKWFAEIVLIAQLNFLFS